MKASVAAVLAVAAGASAWENVTYTTEVVTAVTTYCPGPTEITHGGTTYTITEATTLTITDCPCTVTKPLTTTSAPPVYVNSTTAYPTTVPTTVGTVTPPAATTSATALPTAGAGKAAVMSGAGLAGVLGLAAFFL